MPASAARARGAEGDMAGSPCCWPPMCPPAPIQGCCALCRGGGSDGGSGSPGGPGGSGQGGQGSVRGQEARWGPWGCTAGWILVPSFPPLLTGCKVPGIPLQGGGRSHPLRQGAEGSRRCQAARGGREGGECRPVTQLLSPQATQMCSVGTPRMSRLVGGAWEANLGFQGQGGGSQPPLKPP